MLSLKNMREITLFTAEKRQLKREWSFKKKESNSLAMVKTQCLCRTLMILKDIDVVRSMEYLLPQIGQKRLLK